MKTYQINYDTPEGQKPTDHETVFTVGFMSRYGFIPKIRSGEKGITIRNARKDGKLPQPGQIMRMWADQRTPERERVFELGELEPRCTGVYRIFIHKYAGGIKFKSNLIPLLFPDRTKRLNANNIPSDGLFYRNGIKNAEMIECVNQFARLDGWDTPDEMFNFFKDTLPLNGFIYCWVKL